MAESINEITLLGRLGADPEAVSGGKIVRLRVVTSKRWKDKSSGEWQDRPTWHSIVIFDERLAEKAQKNLKKGSNVWLRGSLEEREYTAKDGTQRKVMEVVLQNFEGQLKLIDPRERSEESITPKSKFPGRDSHNEAKRSGFQPDIDLDDAVPF